MSMDNEEKAPVDIQAAKEFLTRDSSHMPIGSEGDEVGAIKDLVYVVYENQEHLGINIDIDHKAALVEKIDDHRQSNLANQSTITSESYTPAGYDVAFSELMSKYQEAKGLAPTTGLPGEGTKEALLEDLENLVDNDLIRDRSPNKRGRGEGKESLQTSSAVQEAVANLASAGVTENTSDSLAATAGNNQTAKERIV